MTMFFGEAVTLLVNEAESVKVGTAEVWPIRSRYVGEPDRQVGRLVLRDGHVFVRDLTSCGDPRRIPYNVAVRGLVAILAHASDLFGEWHETYTRLPLELV